MNTAFIQFFTYGRAVQLKVGQKLCYTFMSFCESNYSFLEFITPGDYSIARYLNVFHIRNTCLDKQKNIRVRMRDYSESFKIYMQTPEEAMRVKTALDSLIIYLKNYPYSEFSIKNLVRYAIYFTRLANTDNVYSLEDVALLLKRMKIFLDAKTLEQLVRKSVVNMESVTNFDLRRVFKVLLLKEELVAIYKGLLKMSSDEKIKKRKL